MNTNNIMQLHGDAINAQSHIITYQDMKKWAKEHGNDFAVEYCNSMIQLNERIYSTIMSRLNLPISNAAPVCDLIVDGNGRITAVELAEKYSQNSYAGQ